MSPHVGWSPSCLWHPSTGNPAPCRSYDWLRSHLVFASWSDGWGFWIRTIGRILGVSSCGPCPHVRSVRRCGSSRFTSGTETWVHATLVNSGVEEVAFKSIIHLVVSRKSSFVEWAVDVWYGHCRIAKKMHITAENLKVTCAFDNRQCFWPRHKTCSSFSLAAVAQNLQQDPAAHYGVMVLRMHRSHFRLWADFDAEGQGLADQTLMVSRTMGCWLITGQAVSWALPWNRAWVSSNLRCRLSKQGSSNKVWGMVKVVPKSTRVFFLHFWQRLALIDGEWGMTEASIWLEAISMHPLKNRGHSWSTPLSKNNVYNELVAAHAACHASSDLNKVFTQNHFLIPDDMAICIHFSCSAACPTFPCTFGKKLERSGCKCGGKKNWITFNRRGMITVLFAHVLCETIWRSPGMLRRRRGPSGH